MRSVCPTDASKRAVSVIIGAVTSLHAMVAKGFVADLLAVHQTPLSFTFAKTIIERIAILQNKGDKLTDEDHGKIWWNSITCRVKVSSEQPVGISSHAPWRRAAASVLLPRSSSGVHTVTLHISAGEDVQSLSVPCEVALISNSFHML